MKKVFLFFVFCFFCCCAFSSDECIPTRPSSPHLVNNFSKEFPDFISADESVRLEQKLVKFNDSTSNQIVIVIVDDLCGYDANEFSTRLGQKWGVGQGNFNNGVVIMIKPSGGAGQRDAYIAVGYGLEGIIPDITAKQILDNEIIPRFKEGNNYQALDAATDVLMALAKKEYSSDEYANRNNSKQKFPWFGILFIFIIIITSVFRRRRWTTIGGRGTYYGGGWIGGGGWGSGGGSGSGGFGGFGGGSFGGGGAGGNW